jgi:hypothetical protein
VDVEPWAQRLPVTTVVEADGASFYVLHNLQDLDLKPKSAKFDFVISGHTHEPRHFERHSVLYINPGSAGPRRFHLPVTLVILDLAARPWKPVFLELIPSA